MREDLKKATDSYIDCTKKMDSARKFANENKANLPVAKLQKTLDIVTKLSEQRQGDSLTIMSIIPELNDDEYIEWYGVIKPYLAE